MKQRSIPFLIFVMLSISLNAQNKEADPVLFTVSGKPVHVSEFKYIYSKTNGEKADFSENSLREYLDLYTKFKLKVQKARDMQIDTIPRLNKELQGYRKQLADSYLINKEVTEKLVREAYDRKLYDVDFSHILFQLNANAGPKDTMVAYKFAMEAKQRVQKGEDFAKVASDLSDDPSAENNGGRIGYLTVLYPDGFYPLETAAYSLEPGQISDPVRTKMGYHLVKVNDKRPARGEMEASHILIRADEDNAEEGKRRIDSIYQALQSGADFATLAKSISEDLRSKPNGGYLGFFGIGQYETAFEDAAFGIHADNQYSQPFQSSLGWHVIKRISHRGIQPYNVEKRRLEANIKNDGRFENAKEEVLEQIKTDGQFKDYPQNLDRFIQVLNDTFLTFRWKPPQGHINELLFELTDQQVKVSDFVQFLRNASRKRMTYARSGDVPYVAKRLYGEFVSEQCFQYEESRLEEKYPDFKALMREYEEGILLFEVTKMLVWDKASEDTVGLKKFFETIPGKYRWNERADVTVYKLDGESEARINELEAFARNNPVNAVISKFNAGKEILQVEEVKMEKGKNLELKKMDWRAGSLSNVRNNPRGKYLEFMKIEKIIPARDKTLEEAKGYVIADYQDYLEKKWIEELNAKYKIKVNNKVFEKLIKK